MSREGIESFDKIMNCQLLDRYNLTDRKIPAITVKGREIRFNLNAIHLLSDCMYVQILVNREEKYMIILPCEKNDVSAVDWCKISRKTGKVESKDITSKFLSPKLYALMEWNKESSYKIECFFQDFGEGRTLLFFDLTEYVELVRTQQTTADGKVRKITKPYYLADWQESFGPPMRKVIAQTTKDYSGYYIFGEEDSQTPEVITRSDSPSAADEVKEEIIDGSNVTV